MENILLFALFVGFSSGVFSAPVIDNPLSAMQYLMYFNYLEPSDMRNGKLMTQDSMTHGIKMFQKFANLSVTGILDTPTMEKMRQPRCGVPDMMFNSEMARKRRHGAGFDKWTETALTYRIDNITPDFGSRREIENIMKRALKYWADVTKLTFRQLPVNDPEADIIVVFTSADHGDGSPFDGEGGTLAHAYFPGSGIGGDAHFDEDETFVAEEGGVNLLQVAVHEFGHSLGLGHSEVSDAVMAPFYAGYLPDFRLHPDDIAGIQTLYGENVGMSDATMRPETMPPNIPCVGQFDTITRTSDGGTYGFKGENVFKFTSNANGLEKGFPTKISSIFKGLPSDIDASVYWEDEGVTYFFKGDQYYRFRGLTIDEDYPRHISVWNGLPRDLDAGFVWSGNGNTFFIKGDQYYRYNRYAGRVDSGYPRPLSVWKGLPSSIDAAMQWSNSRTYFFSGEEYYRYNDQVFDVDRSYPRKTAKYWTGCVVPERIFAESGAKSLYYLSKSVFTIFIIFAGLSSFY